MGNFYTDVIQKSPYYESPNPVNVLELLEPVTRDAVQGIIAAGRAKGLDLRTRETYRSNVLQEHYFKIGTSHLHVGVHHFGLACDIGLYVNGKFDEVGEHYKFMRNLAETHGLISGIDWGNPFVPHGWRDWDHVQRVALSRQNDLFAGRWYPDARYAPLADMGRQTPTGWGAPLIVTDAAHGHGTPGK